MASVFSTDSVKSSFPLWWKRIWRNPRCTFRLPIVTIRSSPARLPKQEPFEASQNKGGVRDVDNIVEGTARRQGANSSKPEGEKFLLRQAAKPSETSKTFHLPESWEPLCCAAGFRRRRISSHPSPSRTTAKLRTLQVEIVNLWFIANKPMVCL